MYVQIRPYRRAHPQRIADLAALVRYLLEAKDTESDQNHQLRLAGPPVTSRVVQRLSPFGSSVREAAYDLAQQVFNHARESLTRWVFFVCWFALLALKLVQKRVLVAT